jgi:hypothetical protein
MSDEIQGRWEALEAAFVTVPNPDGPILALLLAHDTVVVRPDRIIYSATADSVDRVACQRGSSAVMPRACAAR